MEQIKGTDFAQVESKINNGDWDLNTIQIQSVPYNLNALNNETINTNVGIGTTNPLEISVIVQWNDRGGRPRSTELDTLIANYK